MRIKVYLFLVPFLILVGWFLIKKNSDKPNGGYTIFKPTGVRHEFPYVDLEQKRVIGTVSYKGQTYMTVVIDVENDTVQIEGSVDELGNLTMDKDSYVDMFKSQAKYFIENNIDNPTKHYEELKEHSS
ncbi:hypothetical protein [Paucisalibacillus sp. EB02]|uniref:hypothetical protein n=1 Tax=Paucisalibacillus sp. EB02 TaxID=1347087 RepID=UPI0004AFED1D|nr:hypothetical protein [Paucisalibacillus sp. EB02]